MTDISLKSEGKTGAGMAVLARFAEKGANSFGAVRLFAAIAVIATHSVAVVGGYHSLEPLRALTGLSLGTHAVHVFFALSGFMVAASFERSSGLLDFTLARLLRVLPALIFVNVAIVILCGLFLTTAAPGDYWTVDNIGTFLLRTLLFFSVGTHLEGVFSQNPLPDFINIPIWTIRFEIICYATLLVVMGAMTSPLFKGVTRLVPVLVILVLTGIFLSRPHDYDTFTFSDHLAQFMFAFYLGVAAWLVREKLPVGLAIALALLALTGLAIQTEFVARLPLMILTAAYGSFWLGSLKMGWFQRRTAETDLSYGVYITGFFIQQWLIQALPGTSVYTNAILATAIALVVAWGSWTFVEKPALGLRKRLNFATLRAESAVRS